MADKITQTGIGLPIETLQRLDRLRACLGRSRSFVVDYVLMNGGLDAVEDDLLTDVQAFNRIALALGLTWQGLVEKYVDDFGAKTYPPTVAQLAEMHKVAVETMVRQEAELAAPARSLRDLRAAR